MEVILETVLRSRRRALQPRLSAQKLRILSAPSKHVELLLVKFSVIVKVREEPWVLDTATSVGGCRCHSTLEQTELGEGQLAAVVPGFAALNEIPAQAQKLQFSRHHSACCVVLMTGPSCSWLDGSTALVISRDILSSRDKFLHNRWRRLH